MRLSPKKILFTLTVAAALSSGAIAQDALRTVPQDPPMQEAPEAVPSEPTVVRVSRLLMTAPANWYIADVPTDERNAATILASDDPANSQALMIISVVPKKGRTLAAFNSMTRNFVVTKMDGVIEYERDRTIKGAPAHTFVYEGRSEHSSQGRRKFMRTVIDRGTDFYVLQSVADHVSFAAHAGAIEGMVNSVSWTQ